MAILNQHTLANDKLELANDHIKLTIGNNQFEANLNQLTLGNDKFKPANNHLKPAHTI